MIPYQWPGPQTSQLGFLRMLQVFLNAEMKVSPLLMQRFIMKPWIYSIVLILSILRPTANAAEPTWKAGVARVVITPTKPVWLAGYGSKRVPDGKLHDLWMKALALEAPDGLRAVLIASDFQGVPKSVSDQIFQKVQDKYQLSRAQIMLTFSHNHCSPRLGDDLQDYYPLETDQVELVNDYSRQVIDRAVTLVGEALKNLAPAVLSTGTGNTTFGVNRRNNQEGLVLGMIMKGEPRRGPVDHAVPVLTVYRPDGKLEAVLFGYACHPTTLSFNTYCGDYPGFAQLALEKSHPGMTALFVNTCGGDQNPLPRRSVVLCERYGQMLATAVEETLLTRLNPVEPKLHVAFESIDLPYLQVVSDQELKTAVIDTNAIRARWAKRLLIKRQAGESFATSYPYPLHVWRVGTEMIWIGMGAETVVDYALRFKRQWGSGTWVMGYTDDMIAYIPSRRVWDEGGYEGGSNLYEYGRPAYRWAGDIEERIATSIEQLVRQVRSKADQR